MKISMSSEKGDLKVSVSAQLQHEGFERGALVPLLAAKGGYSEAEALNNLQEMLQNTMPEALLQADSTLRLAIEEQLLSIALGVDRSSGSSISVEKSEQPAGAASLSTTQIIVLYGPKGCARHLTDARLARHFQADKVLRGHFDPELVPPGRTTLVLWNEEALDLYSSILPVLATQLGSISVTFTGFDAVSEEFN